jgi:K+ transporter
MQAPRTVAVKRLTTNSPHAHNNLPLLAMAALGIIYGDIGTSPLYTIKECFSGAHGVAPTPGNILGIFSLVFWSLMLVVGLKYVVFIMRADNKGEGGIFSLLAMLRSPKMNGNQWKTLTVLASFGAALLYGDGVITPAISVLSAIEGLDMATDAAAPYVVPLTCLVDGGELMGIFSGDPANEDAYGSNQCHAFEGRAVAIVRTTMRGEVKLTVGSAGLYSGSATVIAE